MPLSADTGKMRLLQAAMGWYITAYTTAQHGFTDTITGGAKITNYLYGAINGQLRSKGTAFAAEVNPHGASPINKLRDIFVAAGQRRYMLACDAGLAISTTGNAVGVAFTIPVTPGGYRFRNFADNNPFNQQDVVGGLPVPYVICAVGDNGSSGAGSARLLRSTDFGATWSDIALPAGLTPLSGIAGRGATWLAYSVTNQRAIISTDNALTWTQLGAGVANVPVNGVNFVVSGTQENSRFVGVNSANGNLVSSTDGITWEVCRGVDGTAALGRPVDLVTLSGLSAILVQASNGTPDAFSIIWTVNGTQWYKNGDTPGIGVKGDDYRAFLSRRGSDGHPAFVPYTEMQILGKDGMAALGSMLKTGITLDPTLPLP